MKCSETCARGDLTSCYLHARHLSEGLAGPPDGERATALFRQGCEKGHGDSCNAYGHSFFADPTGQRDTNEEFLRAAPHFERGCQLGSSKACTNLGSFLRRTSLGRRHETLGFFERACALGGQAGPTGCLEAGITLRDGDWGFAADREKAKKLLARGCELGGRSACTAASQLGVAVTLSATQELEVWRENCRRGSAIACHHAAYATEYGKGTKLDLVEAERLYRLACYGDSLRGRACYRLAEVRLGASLGSVDVAGAVPPLEWACARNEADGCRVLADLHVMGQGVSTSREKAIELYQKACQIEPPIGCHQAGALTKLEKGATSERVATDLFAEGCASGDKQSCAALKRSGLAEHLAAVGEERVAGKDLHNCETNGYPDACGRVSMRAYERRDFKKARASAEAACRGRYGRSCALYSAMLFKGEGGKRDFVAAIDMSVRACVLGEKKSCAWPKRQLVKRRRYIKPDDVARIEADLDEACRNGVEHACRDRP